MKIVQYVMLLLVGLLITGCATQQTTGNTVNSPQIGKQTIKIGVQLPLSGDLAFIGQSDQKAAELALAEVQKRDTKYNYELVFEDDQFNAKLGSNVAQKLITIDKVDALVTVGSTVGHVVSPIADQNGIIHFAIASDQTIAEGQYNYLHFTRPHEEATRLVDELSKYGYKKIAFITQNQEGSLAEEKEVIDLAKAVGITTTSTQHHDKEEKDFKTIWLKAQSGSPDIIVLLSFSPAFEVMMKQYDEMKITIPLTAVETPELGDHPELFEGKWYIMAAEPTQTFSDTFQTAYNETPKIAAPNVYDNVNMLVYGFEHAETAPNAKPTAAQVAAALATVKDYPGALGPLTINEDGVVISQAIVKTIKGGKPVAVR